MSSRPTFDNAIEALCSHYNAKHAYDKVFAPIIGGQRRVLMVLAGAGIGFAAAHAVIKAHRRRAGQKQVAIRIHSARMRRQRELDAVRTQLANEVLILHEQEIQTMIDAEGPLAVFDAVRSKRFDLRSVVRVYQKRCLLAQDLCNPITHMLTEAASDAAQLQAQAEKTGRMPPLYGLVFSVKEMYGVAGTDSTLGISSYLDQLAHEDSVIVAAMRRLGALLLCKTNFPQTLCSYASSNPIYGLTTNPHDTTRSPGGSSSGEAALLAMNGTMLGWGSDIGGSLRVPAHFCGISSFKPINDRFCGRGVREVISSGKIFISTYGMMSRDVRLIAVVHKTLLQYDKDAIFAHDMEKRAPPIAWRDDLYKNDAANQKPLRIGYFVDDGYFPSTSGIQRTVQYAASLLRERGGHTLVPFELPGSVKEAQNLCGALAFGDRMRDVYEVLHEEQIDPNLQGLFEMACTVYKGSWIDRQICLLRTASMSRRWLSAARALFDVKKPEDLIAAAHARDAYRSEFLDKCKTLNLNVLLCPVSATPALKLGDEMLTESAFSYAVRVNLLNLPAGVVPVTTETVDDQKVLEEKYQELDFEERVAKQSTRGAVGLPLGVQIVGCSPYQEEVCFRVMTELQQYCNDYVSVPLRV